MGSITERVRVPEHVLTRVVDDELVLLNLRDEEFYGLDKVGATIWQALNDSATVSEAVSALLGEFEVDRAVLAGDVEALLIELRARGLVEFLP
jgi:hypothetical protein